MGGVRRHRAVLEQVLAVEMRAVAVGRGDGMDDGELALGVDVVQRRQGRMQAEEAVEIDGAVALAGRGDGEIAAQRAIVAVAMGRHGGEAVHAAAQDDDDEAAVGRGLGHDGAGQRGGDQAAPEAHRRWRRLVTMLINFTPAPSRAA